MRCELYHRDLIVFRNRFPDRTFSEFINVPGEHSPSDIAAIQLNRDVLPDIVLTYPNHDELGALSTRCIDEE
jgi:hypothetical protein